MIITVDGEPMPICPICWRAVNTERGLIPMHTVAPWPEERTCQTSGWSFGMDEAAPRDEP
jgi:hypothetical protein